MSVISTDLHRRHNIGQAGGFCQHNISLQPLRHRLKLPVPEATHQSVDHPLSCLWQVLRSVNLNSVPTEPCFRRATTAALSETALVSLPRSRQNADAPDAAGS